MKRNIPDVAVTRFMGPDEVPYLLTVAQAAAWTGWTYDGLRKLAKKGEIPLMRMGGRPMFRRDLLLDALEKAGRMDVIKSNRRACGRW